MGKLVAMAKAAGVEASINGGVLKLAGGDAKKRAKLVAEMRKMGARLMDEKHDTVWLAR